MREIALQISVCTKCPLHLTRKLAVPGEGPSSSRILFIGEGPGFNENEIGRPFVGQAGKFLGELLSYAGLKREEVFITNVVKCRPPENRDPQPEELIACSQFLDRQIQWIDPMIIVTLGRFSMAKFLPLARISAIHGKPAWVNGKLIVPMYHPAAALHQPNIKPAVIADFVALSATIEQTVKGKKGEAEKNYELPSTPTEQRSLF